MKTPVEPSVRHFDPKQSVAESSDAHLCPQCQQPNQCDIANGSQSCWCFELEVRDAEPMTTASQCLCRRCLSQRPSLVKT